MSTWKDQQNVDIEREIGDTIEDSLRLKLYKKSLGLAEPSAVQEEYFEQLEAEHFNNLKRHRLTYLSNCIWRIGAEFPWDQCFYYLNFKQHISLFQCFMNINQW